MSDGKVQLKPKVKIASDRMSAELEVPPPPEGAEAPTVEQILAELRAAGVIHGIEESPVAMALMQPGKAVVVARGEPPEHGRDGRIDWVVEPSSAHAPSERADGSVDYYNLDLIRVVKSGDVLARRIACTQGNPGTGVDGKPIPAKPGKEASLPRGQNMQAAGDELRAACDGHLAKVNGVASVQSVFEVPGDVDFSTGNIIFDGSVRVRGSLQQGFTVKSGGDVDIAGIVAGATIQAKGHLRVGKGIQGSHRGAIRVGGNVVAKFIENADVRAGGDVLVNDGIMQSQVSADGKVFVTGRPGRLSGGHIRAGAEVAAGVLGAPLGTQTIVEVGVPPALHERLSEVRAELKHVLPELEKATTAARMMKDLKESGKATRLDPAMLQRLVESLQALTTRREQLEAEMEDIQHKLDEAKAGKVTARERVFTGTVLRFGQLHYTAEEDMTGMRFHVNANGLIEPRPA